jgi:hypothetical protein
MPFVGKTATSQRARISVFPPAGCSQDISLTPSTFEITDLSTGEKIPVKLNYYDVGTKNLSNKIITSDKYAVGVDLTVSSTKIITPGLYTLEITGTGSLNDATIEPPAKPVIKQTVQINVTNVGENIKFEEF